MPDMAPPPPGAYVSTPFMQPMVYLPGMPLNGQFMYAALHMPQMPSPPVMLPMLYISMFTPVASGLGNDFIIGYTFMQCFYTVFNDSRFCISFASTPFSDATTN
ncbi:hypothetical protein BDR04DRAFT_1161573 [Suillus decipiens]|nr:hypothetical protein BDR04DRAFT_1161573 [Suillus decipiens]